MRNTRYVSKNKIGIFIIFLIYFSVLTNIQAQQAALSNERLNVWKDMIHKNDVYVSAYVGYGSYSMNGMHQLQTEIVASSGLNAIVNSDFPSFWLYGISISQQYDASRFGMDIETMSTGARSSIADYSGQYTSDFVCNALKLGVFIEKDLNFKINGYNQLYFGYRLEAGGIASNVTQQGQLIINGLEQGTQTSILQMASVAPFFEPTIYANWQLLPKTLLQLSTGFMLDFPQAFGLNYFISSDYQIGWAGYRIKLGLQHKF